ncbi:hypothetical protein L2E82_21968 [Cichorium intybus]|uniref:Uncharacterized protein n=1 Tax=Cichorium intybus TaxID=13427 RepID=A0ACB9DWS7_CICIN|nr:hypothetical protein L2E82_21968 [Cichorium intybus]
MDLPANHQSHSDLDWFNYFDDIDQDDQPHFRDDMLDPCDLSEKVDDQNVLPLQQDQSIIPEYGLQEFDPLEDLSSWDCWGDGLPLLISDNDDSSACHSEGTHCSTFGAATADHLGFQDIDPIEDLTLWDSWDDGLPLLSCNHVDSSQCRGGAICTSGADTADHLGRKAVKRSRPLELEDIEKVWSNELGLEDEIEMLEEHKRMMEKLPDMQFTESLKKLRQACFKATYKKRRLNSPP